MAVVDHPLTQRLRSGPVLIGMIHLPALPGTPSAALSPTEIVAAAVRDAETYVACGVDLVLLENMHDVPYTQGVGPEIVASLAAVAAAVRQRVAFCGIQVLAGAPCEALAVAHAAELDFVRVEGFAYAHVADEGITESCAGELLRFRRRIGAERVQVWADVMKKHASHALTADLDMATRVETAAFFGADAVIVTGTSTGDPVDVDDLAQATAATDLPVLVGSGVTPEQIPALAVSAAGVIVGSCVKEEGRWDQPLCADRIERLVAAVRDARRP